MGEAAEEIDDTKTPEELAAEKAAAEKAAADKAAAEAAAGEEGFEVVEPGGATPAPNSVPLPAYLKAKEKWKGRVASAKKDNEGLAAENQLLKLQLEQANSRLKQPKPMPKASDFEGKPEEFEKASRDWIAEQATAAAAEAVRKASPDSAAARPAVDDETMQGHYERAAKLKAPDFEDAENVVIEAIGLDAARQIIAQFDNSEVVMYALGRNPKKLSEIASELKANPVRAVVNLTRYAAGLQLKPRKAAPDPDNPEKRTAGAAVSDAQKQLDRMRDQGKPFSEIKAFKKECRAKGIEVE